MRVPDALIEQDHGDEVVAGDGEAAEAEQSGEGAHAVTFASAASSIRAARYRLIISSETTAWPSI